MFRLYFRPSRAAEWEYRGDVCLGGGEDPVTPGAIGVALREPFEELVPGQAPGVQPAAGTLVRLPTIFFAGQPPRTSGTVEVLGFEVAIAARCEWRWTFDTGVSRTFAVPGGRWPNKDVTHTYTTTGERAVTVQTTWRGQWVLDGEGPFDIADPVVQVSPPLRVPVFQARSQLIDGPPGRAG